MRDRGDPVAGRGGDYAPASMSDAGLEAATRKMEEAGVPAAAVRTFADFYRQVEAGETGELPEDELEPIEGLPALDDLPASDDAPLDRAVVIKLNGGLGTSMGMDRAKSLVEVKDGRSFLDVVACQVLTLRRATGARVPLVLMNSFVTRDDTLAALEAPPALETYVPLDFVQNREPKLTADALEP